MAKMYYERGVVVVGDGGYFKGTVTEDDGTTLRNLAGCAVALTFWRPGATEPHVTRFAEVTDAANGEFTYKIEGDEYATADAWVLIQPTIRQVEFSATAPGRGGFETCGPVIKRKVLPTP